MEAEKSLSPSDHAEEVPQLIVWVNPDYLPICDKKAAATFVEIARRTQTLFLFDHETEFEELFPPLQETLAAGHSTRLRMD